MKVSRPILSEPAPVVSGKEAGMKTWLLAGRWRIVLAGILVVAAPLIALASYVYFDLADHLERLALERKRDHVEHVVHVIGDKLKTTIAIGRALMLPPQQAV
jgi:hypothetical protein